jgi:hypothetical protein
MSGPDGATPTAVRASQILWWLAIGTALIELAVHLTQDGHLATAIGTRKAELAVRGAAFGLLFLLSLQMARGRNRARIALTVLFGGLGTLSLVMEPLGWLVAGGDALAFLAWADGSTWIVVASRFGHLLCVLVATVLMFTRDSHRFFEATTQAISP